MRFGHRGLGALVVLLSAPAVAKDDPSSPLLAALEKCLAIADDRERLACTDVAARRLIEASRAREVVVVDRDEIRKTRKSLFGFTLPRIGLFGKGGPDNGEDVDRVEVRIVRVTPAGYGKLSMTLEDGAHWTTTEAWSDPTMPRIGAILVIKRGAIGSYMVSIKGGRAVRAIRTG